MPATRPSFSACNVLNGGPRLIAGTPIRSITLLSNKARPLTSGMKRMITMSSLKVRFASNRPAEAGSRAAYNDRAEFAW